MDALAGMSGPVCRQDFSFQLYSSDMSPVCHSCFTLCQYRVSITMDRFHPGGMATRKASNPVPYTVSACDPVARLLPDTRHSGSASPQGCTRCGARPVRNVPSAGALARSARLDASGAPTATCYEESVFNGVIDLRGVPLPMTTLWAGDSFVNRCTFTLARGPVFGAKPTILSSAQSPPPRMGTRLLQDDLSNGQGPSRQRRPYTDPYFPHELRQTQSGFRPATR